MSKRKREKRIQALTESIADAVDSAAATSKQGSRSDGSLFMVDAAGGGRSGKGGLGVKRPRSAEAPGGAASAAPSSLSTKDLIADAMVAVSRVKYLRAEADAEDVVGAKAPRVNLNRPRPPPAPRARKVLKAAAAESSVLSNVWAPGAALPPSAKGAPQPQLRLLSQPPPGGASYNPSLEDHQRALGAAARREHAEAARKAATRAALLPLPEKAAPKRLSKKAQTALEAQREAQKAARKAQRAGLGKGGATSRFALLDAEESSGDEGAEAEEEEEEEEEEEAGADSQTPAPSDGASREAKKAARALAKKLGRREAARSKRVARAADKATAVENALTALAAEERVAKRRAAEAAGAAAAAATEEEALRPEPILSVPLSSELSGSLWGMKPLPASAHLGPVMEALVKRGETGKRRSIPRVALEDDGRGVRVATESMVRYSKGVSRHKRVLEFPRNKNFGPAEDAVRDAMARGELKGNVMGIMPNHKAQQAAEARVGLLGAKGKQ
jgi:hypothetical protein